MVLSEQSLIQLDTLSLALPLFKMKKTCEIDVQPTKEVEVCCNVYRWLCHDVKGRVGTWKVTIRVDLPWSARRCKDLIRRELHKSNK